MSVRSEYVQIEHKPSSLWITIKRPSEKNALTLPMLQTISEALSKVWESSAIQMVVLRGSGGIFSAGLDLTQLFASREKAKGLFDGLNNACLALRRSRQPVLACVDGPCIAGGLQLAASCDLILASNRATFQAPGARLGFLHSSPAAPLMRCLPEKIAMELLLFGDEFDAERARAIGLVNWVAKPEEMDDIAETRVRHLVARLSLLRGDGKAGLYEQVGMDEEKAYHFLVQKMLGAWDTGIPKKQAEKALGKTL